MFFTIIIALSLEKTTWRYLLLAPGGLSQCLLKLLFLLSRLHIILLEPPTLLEILLEFCLLFSLQSLVILAKLAGSEEAEQNITGKFSYKLL